MDYGIKITQEGFDVHTASNQELVFSSALNTYKIVDTKVLTLPLSGLGGDVGTASVAHGLSYPPAWTGYGYYTAAPNEIYPIPNVGFTVLELVGWVTPTHVFCSYSDTGNPGAYTEFTFEMTLFAQDLTRV